MRTLALRVALISLALSACTGSNLTGPTGPCIYAEDCDEGQVCLNGECVGDGTLDSGISDSTESDSGDDGFEFDLVGDTGGDESEDGAEDGDVEPDESGLACGSCLDDSDCQSGFCVAGPFGQECAELCFDSEDCTCGDDYRCLFVTNTGTDATRLCLPVDENILCSECTSDDQCGGQGSYCLEQLDGSYCATNCEVDRTCRDGFACNLVTLEGAGRDGEDLTTRLCEPQLGVCDCLDGDEDGYGDGPACLGRDCNDEDRFINPGAFEICNGLDDDCLDGADDPFDFLSSREHCGGCDRPCFAGEFEVAVCDEGACERECFAEYFNCTEEPGCETRLDQDDSCGTSCDDMSDCPNLPNVEEGACVAIEDADGWACDIACAEPWIDCNEEPSDGCEINFNSDATCGDTCELAVNCAILPNVASATCSDGECEILACEGDWANCTADPLDGCETLLSSDDTCGTCETNYDCAELAGVEAGHCELVADAFACVIDDCSEGLADCVGGFVDGCETSLRTPTSCGAACGATVDCTTLPHTDVVSCPDGSCRIDACEENWDDCTEAAGCETDLTALATCGSCATDCSDLPHVAEAACGDDGGGLECQIVRCDDGWADCNPNPMDGCETPIDDVDSCGLTCAGIVDCTTLPNVSGVSCTAGACAITSCDTGWDNCTAAAGCETEIDLTTFCGLSCASAVNCTALDNVNEVACAGGTCVINSCDDPFDDCTGGVADGCETNLDEDVEHCGECSYDCVDELDFVDEATCSSGSCRVQSCVDGYGHCDTSHSNGCETNTNTAVSDCGACDNDCDALPHVNRTSCNSGACQIDECDDPWGNCTTAPGCETNTDSNESHCGDCNYVCEDELPLVSEGSCSAGSCQVVSCYDPWAHCDSSHTNGCEVNTNTREDHCGECDNDCDDLPRVADGNCSTGTCTVNTCDSGWAHCDSSHVNGCETNITTATNCGDCGVNCRGLDNVSTATCTGTTCNITGCSLGFSECNNVINDGCERNLNAGAGSCGAFTYLGSLSGDSGGANINYTGWGEGWYYFRLTEDNGSVIEEDITADLSLASPTDINYNLWVECGGTCTGASPTIVSAGAGGIETTHVEFDDSQGIGGHDDDRYIYFRVTWAGGSTLGCGAWTITIDGDSSEGSDTC